MVLAELAGGITHGLERGRNRHGLREIDGDALGVKGEQRLFRLWRGRDTLLAAEPTEIDRIAEITENGGEFGKGLIRAELDVKPDLWFFGCHFKNDPVMPGCLGLDAMWQMVGFYLGWIGGEGRGRALGLGELKFSGQVLPNARKVVYNIDMKRVMRSKLVLGVADGWLSMDGEIIYRAKDLKVGLFKQGMDPA